MNVENLCDVMNMSWSSLYNKIKVLINDLFSDFICKVCMNEVSILLKSKCYIVFEVLDMMGFSDFKYFMDIFKKYYGVLLSIYMK